MSKYEIIISRFFLKSSHSCAYAKNVMSSYGSPINHQLHCSRSSAAAAKQLSDRSAAHFCVVVAAAIAAPKQLPDSSAGHPSAAVPQQAGATAAVPQ